MNRHALPPTLIVAAMLLASSALAGTDIVKCTDPDGHVTLTDQPCTSGADEAPLAAEQAPPARHQRSAEHFLVGALPPPVHAAPAIKRAPPGRAMARDVATLKTARANLLLIDSAMAALRQQRIAGIR